MAPPQYHCLSRPFTGGDSHPVQQWSAQWQWKLTCSVALLLMYA